MTENAIENNLIKDTRNLFRLKKEKEAIKEKIFRDIRTLFESKKEHYKLVRIRIF